MDIDLIPTDYRARLWRLAWLKGCAGTLGAMLTVTLAAYLVLMVLEQVASGELSTLQQRRDITAQQQTFIEQLTAEKQELERQWRLLSELKRGTDSERIFGAIDRAFVDHDIWFDKWEFNREGSPPQSTGAQPRNSRKGSSSGGGGIETHMSIGGDAMDHVALSNFVRRLLAQPEIADVKVRRTSTEQIRGVNVIAFDLTVTVEPLEAGHGFLGAL